MHSGLSKKLMIPESILSLFSKIKDGVLVLLYKQNKSSVINSAVFLLFKPRLIMGGL